MKITELINHVGAENVSVQSLAQNMTNFRQGKRDATISFVTSKEHGQAIAKEAAGIKADTLGLVLWIPRAALPEDMR